jgi:glyoxylase-like metal-dependent hydrolase (beta-lactamase superfamily II)
MKVLKRLAVAVGIVVVLAAAGAAFIYFSAFAPNRPIQDGQVLAGSVTTVQDGFVSIYLLDAGNGTYALVDAGRDKAGKAILKALADKGASPSQVTAVFLTHGHGDHTAALPLFPKAEVYAMGDEATLLANIAFHPLQDGDIVRVGNLPVEVFATPGHTPGSAVYFARGVLFFGDSAGGGKDGTVMPAVKLFSKAPQQNVDSLKKLEARLLPRASEVKTLAFAHSGPLDGFAPLLAFTQTH